MLSWTVPPWAPAKTDREDSNVGASPFDLSTTLEAQARLWNQLLDANRSFWSLYAPWLSATAWNPNTALEPAQAMDRSTEPAATVDGVHDAFESQARLWNHLLDANRNFWSAITWSVPGAPWLPSVDDQPASAANDETSPSAAAARPAKAAPAARKKAATRSR